MIDRDAWSASRSGCLSYSILLFALHPERFSQFHVTFFEIHKVLYLYYTSST